MLKKSEHLYYNYMDKLHNLILTTSLYLQHDTTSIWIKYMDKLHNLIAPTGPYLWHDTT